MPIYSQGDIFEKTQEKDLTIVFVRTDISRVSHNLAEFWYNNQLNEQPNAKELLDCTNQPIEYQPNRWMWCIPLETHQGLSDIELKQKLDEIIQWVADNQLKTIITNGVKNACFDNSGIIQVGAINQRINYLRQLAIEYEQKHSISIELISKDDSFSKLNRWVQQ